MSKRLLRRHKPEKALISGWFADQLFRSPFLSAPWKTTSGTSVGFGAALTMLGMVMDSRLSALGSGARLADIVLLITVLEAAVLLAWHYRTSRGLAPQAILGMLVPGIFLLLALRMALVGSAWPWIALCLVLSGLAHAGDLIGRLTRQR